MHESSQTLTHVVPDSDPGLESWSTTGPLVGLGLCLRQQFPPTVREERPHSHRLSSGHKVSERQDTGSRLTLLQTADWFTGDRRLGVRKWKVVSGMDNTIVSGT